MPKYKLSSGESIEKSKIDRKVTKAKEEYLQTFFDNHSYYFCERTNRSDLSLDCSHIISVRMCQSSGQSELAWCQNNIELLNRDAHNQIESMSNSVREDWYHRRKEGMSFEEFKNFNNL